MTDDPTRVEARLLGALREISPEMRREWAEADRKLWVRAAVVRSVLGLVLLACLVWVLH